MAAQYAIAFIAVLASGPVLAERLDPDAAQRFVFGKQFAFACFDGSRGDGRVYGDGSVIQRSISFGGWTVESGPQVWTEEDVWKQIEGKLAKSDVAGAAATLRRYLEYISTILADNLRARVEYHSNGHYDLSDLWPAVIHAWKARLQEAKDSAGSWEAATADIEATQADTKQKVAATQSEQWMINKALHYNAWENLQKDEFAKVAAAFRVLLKSMRCANPVCSEFLCVSPPKGNRESLRCGCGQTNLNLKMK